MKDELRPLWDFGDLDASEARFSERLAAGRTTARARSSSRSSRASTACAVTSRTASVACAKRRALAGSSERAGIRIDLERGRLRNSNGDPEAALPLFVRATERAEEQESSSSRPMRHTWLRSRLRAARAARVDEARHRARGVRRRRALLGRAATQQPRLGPVRGGRARRGARVVRAGARAPSWRPGERRGDRLRQVRRREGAAGSRAACRRGEAARARRRLDGGRRRPDGWFYEALAEKRRSARARGGRPAERGARAGAAARRRPVVRRRR